MPGTQPDQSDDIATQRVISLPWLLGSALAVLLLLPGLYLWHKYQLQRSSESLLDRAKALEAERDWSQSANYLFRYTRLQPDEKDARIQLARVYDQSAANDARVGRAIELYYQAIGVAEEKSDKIELITRLAELLLSQRRYIEAESEALKLLDLTAKSKTEIQGDASPSDNQAKSAAARLYALALVGRREEGSITGAEQSTIAREVVPALRQAITLQADAQLVSILARIYRDDEALKITPPEDDKLPPLTRPERETAADKMMDELVGNLPKDPLAWLARGIYRDRYKLPGVADDLAAALKLGPDNPDVLLASAAFEMQAGRAAIASSSPTTALSTTTANADPTPDAANAPTNNEQPSTESALPAVAREHFELARGHYEKVLKLDDKNVLAYVGLGNAALALGDPDQAITIWTDSLTEVGEDNFAINWPLAEQLIARVKLPEADTALIRLEKTMSQLDQRPDRHRFVALQRSIRLLRARYHFVNAEYVAASKLLNELAAMNVSSNEENEEKLQAIWLLGACYRALNQWDQAAITYQNGATLRPNEPAFRVQAAAAWEALGATERAITDYQLSLRLGASPVIHLNLARNLMNQQRWLPAERRDWREFDTSIKTLQELKDAGQLPDSWRLNLLLAQSEIVRAALAGSVDTGMAKAYEIYQAVEQEFPKDAVLLEQLVSIYQRIGKPADADRCLDSLAKLDRNPAEIALLRSQLLTIRKQYLEASQVLKDAMAQASNEDRLKIEIALVQNAYAQGELKSVDDELARLAKEHPQDRTIAQMQAERALEQQDTKALANWEQSEGDSSALDPSQARWFKIRRLLSTVKSADAPELKEVSEELGKLETARPGWAEVHVLRGKVARLQGNLPQAAQSFQQAIDLGDRQLATYEQLIGTLHALGRLREASTYLSQLDQAVPESSSLSNLALRVALELNEKDRALDVAKRAFERRPDDMLARLWYGQMLAQSKQINEAEQVLQDATRLAPENPETWNALFSFYARNGKPEQARATLTEMATKAKLTDAQRSFVLAQGFEMLGDRDQAEAAYVVAAAAEPKNLTIKTQLASFYMKSDVAKAAQVLDEIVQQDPANGRVRRALAAVLASQGGQAQWDRALKLLEGTDVSGSEQTLDRRLQALLLSRRGGSENLDKARQLLRDLVKSPNAPPSDHLLLASLCEQASAMAKENAQQDRDLAEAKAQYMEVVTRDPPDREALGLFISYLLRNKEFDEAERWLTTLEKQPIQGVDLGSLPLRAQWLKQNDRAGEIAGLIEPRVDQFLKDLPADDARRKPLIVAVIKLYKECDQLPQAEIWSRRLLELDPAMFAPVADTLVRMNRTSDAVTVCIEAATKVDTAVPALVLSGVLAQGKPEPRDFERAEPILAHAEQRYANDPTVLLELANARIVQNRSADAIRLMERSLELNPQNVRALNNLATIMSAQPELRSKAHEYIDRAIAIAGPRADLYDTKGSIFVYEDKAQESLPFLQFAASAPDADPRYQFHLAAAFQKLGDKDQAASTFKSAVERNVNDQFLMEPDHQLMSELQGLLKQP